MWAEGSVPLSDIREKGKKKTFGSQTDGFYKDEKNDMSLFWQKKTQYLRVKWISKSLEIKYGWNKHKRKIVSKALTNFKILSGSASFLKTSEFFGVYSQQVYLHLWDFPIVISQSGTRTEQKKHHTWTCGAQGSVLQGGDFPRLELTNRSRTLSQKGEFVTIRTEVCFLIVNVKKVLMKSLVKAIPSVTWAS